MPSSCSSANISADLPSSHGNDDAIKALLAKPAQLDVNLVNKVRRDTNVNSKTVLIITTYHNHRRTDAPH